MKRILVWLLVAATGILVPISRGESATLPGGFTEIPIASGLQSPTSMELAPDGRIFVCQQGGALRVIKGGTLLAKPFLTLTVDQSGERGLLALTFDSNFVSNQYVYVHYTATSPTIHNRVSRFTASGDTALPGSEVVIIDLPPLVASNHNGGPIRFAPDGTLYIAVGDNSQSTAPQSTTSLFGKLLRLNPDGTIPTDNPFYNSATGIYRSIWALGLRNPFSITFHPITGTLFLNDVGQATWEEINQGIAGGNYGWPTVEGPSSDPSFLNPIYSYGHGTGDTLGCAIVGSAFYNRTTAQFPVQWVNKYFYGDYCTGWIRAFNPADSSSSAFASGIASPVDLKVSPDGSLYYLARGSGASTGIVQRIVYTASLSAKVVTSPLPALVTVGAAALFEITASGEPTLDYQWQRDGSDIGGANGARYLLPSAQLTDSGAFFRCIVSNNFGADTSATAVLRVTSDRPPVAVISQPPTGTTYRAGDTIAYSGSASDPEQGSLPASAFTWRVDFHHDTHIHPFIPSTGGDTGGSFIIPVTGETSSNVWYRIMLDVTDASGLSDTAFLDILPRTVTVRLETVPSGLQLLLDGEPVVAPDSFVGVVGIQRTIGAPSPQSKASVNYEFSSWSDGGAMTHTISTPNTDSSYTATFTEGGLPIQLASFTGMSDSEGKVLLGWTTLSEVNNLGFYIERRNPEAASFEVVSPMIPGAGTSLESHSYSWSDSLRRAGSYRYRIRQVDLQGSVHYSFEIVVEVNSVLGLREGKSIPLKYALEQNYPNPFNPSTTIHFEIPEWSNVRLRVFTIVGEELAPIAEGVRDAGYYTLSWRPDISTGIYIIRLEANSLEHSGTVFMQERKVILMR